jgi:hypothetical protein
MGLKFLDTLDDDDDVDDGEALPLARRIVKEDRTSAARAGALTGAIGALVMVAATDAVMGIRAPGTHPFFALLASPIHVLAPALASPLPLVIGAAGAVLLGAAIGSFFSRLTRRLVKLVPLLLWTTLFFAALWIVLDAFLLARFPGASAQAPFLPILAGIEAFALVLCLQLPVRRRRAVEARPAD